MVHIPNEDSKRVKEFTLTAYWLALVTTTASALVSTVISGSKLRPLGGKSTLGLSGQNVGDPRHPTHLKESVA